MSKQLFADGLGSITIIGATVRLDFFSFSPTEKEPGGQPKGILEHRLVIPVGGFLHAAGKIQEAVEAIAKIGTTPAADTSKVDVQQTEPTSTLPEPVKSLKPPFP